MLLRVLLYRLILSICRCYVVRGCPFLHFRCADVSVRDAIRPRTSVDGWAPSPKTFLLYYRSFLKKVCIAFSLNYAKGIPVNPKGNKCACGLIKIYDVSDFIVHWIHHFTARPHCSQCKRCKAMAFLSVYLSVRPSGSGVLFR